MLALLLLEAASAAAAATASSGAMVSSLPACAVGRGDQTLRCPAGSVIGSVESALLGTFDAPRSDDCGATDSAEGCANVVVQVERLCKGRASCTIGCNCSTPSGCHLDGTCGMPAKFKPHPPPAPAPGPPHPHPMPPAPPGFRALSTGSCRDSDHKEPPFYSNNNKQAPVTVVECLKTCGADDNCTAISYCTGPCQGACHVYTTAETPPPHHTAWTFDPAQGGDARRVTTATKESFWDCYVKGADPHAAVPLAPAPAPAPLLCSCTSGALSNAVPGGAACSAAASSIAARASCVPAAPPPPPPSPPATTVPTSLRLEFLEPPVLGLDKMRPHFSWALPVPAAGARLAPRAVQSAAEVVVRDSEGRQLWSSGRVPGPTPLLVPNASLPLASDRAYSWAVRVWDEGLWPSDYSASANFTTGLLQQSDWGAAKWIIGGSIGEAKMLRKEFSVPAGLEVGRVSLQVSACQYVILQLDGQRVGDHELDVVWTKFAEVSCPATKLLPCAPLRPDLTRGRRNRTAATRASSSPPRCSRLGSTSWLWSWAKASAAARSARLRARVTRVRGCCGWRCTTALPSRRCLRRS